MSHPLFVSKQRSRAIGMETTIRWPTATGRRAQSDMMENRECYFIYYITLSRDKMRPLEEVCL